MIKNINNIFKEIVEISFLNAKCNDFKKRGFVFRKFSDQATGIIQFQKSRTNTNRKLSFTIELAIVVSVLHDESSVSFSKVGSADGHLRERVGMLLPERVDKWWDIVDTTEVALLTAEISNVISYVAVPYVERYLDLQALIELWESEQSPGLTDIQRARCLDKLKSYLRKNKE